MVLDDKNVFVKFIASVQAAIAGLLVGFREERHIRFHVFMMVLVVLMGLYFQINNYEWLAIWLVIGLVITLELVNSAIERVTDLIVGDQYHPLAKNIKDISAGAVLVAAVISIIIGLIVFIPKILTLFT